MEAYEQKTGGQVLAIAHNGKLSNGLMFDAKDGRCPEVVGNTVNVKDASFNNSIGAPTLQVHWEDPDFDPKQRAFYYVRVLEIPTPNWTTFDAVHFGTDLPDDVPASIQDRAYTSPIRYTPE